MTDKFHVWFWNRRTVLEKFFVFAIPLDLLFVLIMQLTPVPGLGVFFLTVFLTIGIGIIFTIVSFIVEEYKKYQKEKEIEADRIVRTLKGEIKTDPNDILEHLKAYRVAKRVI